MPAELWDVAEYLAGIRGDLGRHNPPIQLALRGGVQTAIGAGSPADLAPTTSSALFQLVTGAFGERFEGSDIDMDPNDDLLAQRRGDIKLKLK